MSLFGVMKQTIVRSHPFTGTQSQYATKGEAVPFAEKHHTGNISFMFWGSFSDGPLVAVKGTIDAKKYKKFSEKTSA